MGGDEVFGNRQSLAVRVLDRGRDDLTLRVRNKATHTGDVADLQPVTAGTRGDHAVDGVVPIRCEVRLEFNRDFLVRFGPDADELLVALEFGDESLFELLVDLGGQLLVLLDDRTLGLRGDDVAQCDGDTRAGRPTETSVLEAVERCRNFHLRVLLGEDFDDLGDDTLVGDLGHVGVVRRELLVEDRLSEGRRECGPGREVLGRNAIELGDAGNTHLDERVDVDVVQVVRHGRFGDAAEDLAFTDRAGANGREVVQTDDHVLGRNRNRSAVRGLEDVVRGEHEDARFGLGLNRQRKVNRHLVAVKVGVERCTDERVKLNRFTFDELRFECLNSEAVKRRCTVQENRAVTDDLFELSPDLGVCTLDHALRALDRRGKSLVLELLDDIRLEQFESHLLGQSTLVKLELRTNNDDRTTRVVDALSEQVLAETSLLSLEHVGQ